MHYFPDVDLPICAPAGDLFGFDFVQSMEALDCHGGGCINQNAQIARNALRHEVSAYFNEVCGPGSSCRVDSFFAAFQREDAIALRLLAEEQFPNAFSGEDYLDRPALCLAPVALARRALVAWLAVHGLMRSVSAIHWICYWSQFSKEFSVRHSVQGVFIVSDDRFVQVKEVESTPIEGLVSLSMEVNWILPSGSNTRL